MNLLPPEVQARRYAQRRRLSALAALGGIGAALAVGAGLSWTQARAHERSLSVALAEQARLQQAAADLDDVSRLARDVRSGQASLAQALADEVLWSRYLADLSGTTPEQAWLLHLTAAQDGAAATPTRTVAPRALDQGTAVGDDGIGQARFAGRADSHDEVAAFLAALAEQRGHSGAYLVDSTVTQDEAGRDVVAFNAYVTLTRQLLSRRYPARVAQ